MKFKRKAVIAAWAGFTVMTLFGVISGSLAWFKNYIELPQEKVEGTLRGAYFAYGDGSAKEPFGINDARHLYNLAWLQYTGYFNRDLNGDGQVDKTYYFEIDPKLENQILDMSNYVLPPIGTERYPFLGNFEGNGCVINNLRVSNSFSDYGGRHPTTINSTIFNQNQPQIVGLFGVIGSLPNSNYTYNTKANAVSNFGLTNSTIKTVTQSSLIGVAAGYVNGDISKVAVDSSGVNIDSGTTLALSYTSNLSDYGVVGYVADAAQDQPQRKKRITRVDETIYDINISGIKEFNAAEQGDTQGFGGSIDMKSLYNRLFTIWKNNCTKDTAATSDDSNFAKIPTLAEQSVSQKGVKGNIVFNETNSLANASAITGSEGGYFGGSRLDNDRAYYNYSVADGGKETSSYGFIVEPGGIETGTRNFNSRNYSNKVLDEGRYMCLTGERSSPVANGATLTTKYYDSFTGSFVSYSSGAGNKNYMHFNGTPGTAPENVSAANDDASTASRWFYSSTNYSFETKQLASNTTYYLNCDSASGALSITTTDGTQWDHDTKGYYVASSSDSNLRYYLGFDGDSWTTTEYRIQATTEKYYLIHSGNNYMTHAESVAAAGTVGNINSASEPAGNNVRWYYRNGNISATESGSAYYLYCTRSNNSDLQYGTSSSYRYAPVNELSETQDTNSSLRYYYSSRYTYYYVRYNNSQWQNSTTTATLTFTPKAVSHSAGFKTDVHSSEIELSKSETIYSDEKSSTGYNGGSPDKVDSYFKTNPTYMPLKEKEVKNGNTTTTVPGVPDPYNTGYIVSGAKYQDDQYGDIRVSVFPLFNAGTNDQNALGTSGFTRSTGKIGTVYTVNDTGGFTATPANTETYTTSRAALESNVLKGQYYVFGLHFMNAKISHGTPESQSPIIQDHVDQKVGQSVYAGKAVINKDEFYNYELPTDCIDFNLKEKGYINFFAGTYYPNNSAFFSLYEIVRDETKDSKPILQLRKIKAVYSDASSGKESPNSYIYEYDKAYTFNQSTGKYSVPYKLKTDSNNNLIKVKLDDTAYVEHDVSNSIPNNYSLVFQTKWLEGESSKSGSLKSYSAYYFEIAMNSGEYALGSVEGKAGAYLMYLDIGANAAKTYRTIVSEHFESTEMIMEFPLGIAVFGSPAGIANLEENNKEAYVHLACVKISPNFSGTIKFEIDGENANKINLTGCVATNAPPSYLGEQVTLGTTVALEPMSTVTKDIKRLQYWDYNVNTQERYKTIITDITTGGQTSRQVQYFNAAGEEVIDKEKWKIYRTATGVKFSSADIENTSLALDSTGDNGLFYTNTASPSTLISLRFYEIDDTGAETSYTLNMNPATDNAGKTKYEFANYTITVESTGEGVVVTVITKGNKTIIINGQQVDNEHMSFVVQPQP